MDKIGESKSSCECRSLVDDEIFFFAISVRFNLRHVLVTNVVTRLCEPRHTLSVQLTRRMVSLNYTSVVLLLMYLNCILKQIKLTVTLKINLNQTICMQSDFLFMFH